MIQRRMDGSVNFNQSWNKYEAGFGNLNGEYWLGLRYIHRLTASAAQQLRVDLEDIDGNTAYALYNRFTVYGAADQYRLQKSEYTGSAGDAMEYDSEQKFSTYDRDNDPNPNRFCAREYGSPWWHYSDCSYAHLNGIYHNTRFSERGSVNWYYWERSWKSMKKANMKVRRRW